MSVGSAPGFLAHIRTALDNTGLLKQRTVVAVSGGADSVSLLRGLVQIMDRSQLCVAHLDHQLRGAESTADAEWVAELSRVLNLEHVGGFRDVAALAQQLGVGLEEAARRARHEFLESVARKFDASVIALAHTANDQAETVLHHILRGTGLSGLSGMQPARPFASGQMLVRPLLAVRRDEVLSFLKDLGQNYRDDRSNVDTAFTRNRIRHQLLPLLEQDFNPLAIDGLLRLSQQAGEVQSALEFLACEFLESVLIETRSAQCQLDVSTMPTRPRHLLREMFVQLWRRQDWPRQKMGFDDWNRLVDVALQGTAVTLPGPIEARRKRTTLTVRLLESPAQ